MGRGMGRRVSDFFIPLSYRLSGIIHREQDEPLARRSSRLAVSDSGRAMCQLYFLRPPVRLATGFAARPGRRISFLERSTLIGRISPQDSGLRPMTNTQNFSPASGRDEFYKTFAGGGQAGISLGCDGSVDVAYSSDGNFDAWEAANTKPVPTPSQ